jgi:aminopeptidase N
VSALTHAEARVRAGLITVGSYDVALDLTVTPVRSRTVIRFRCAEPGAKTFADLTAAVTGAGAVINGVPADVPADGRLTLTGLAAENVLTVEAEVPARALTRFTDPADGGEYVLAFAYPTVAPDLFCCFDQLDLLAPLTLTLRAPAGWTCVANGAVAERPAPGTAGTWRFAPVRMKPLELTFAAGPFRARALPSVPAVSPAGTPVTLAAYGRAALSGTAVGQFVRYLELVRDALGRHQRVLGVACPYPKYEIVAFPDVPFRAASVPGLMIVGEDLLGRLADPDDEFAAMIAAHEVAHLWFGGLVGMRWWDDLWLEESLATYLSYHDDAGWTAFSHEEKPRALRADELPTTEPVSSPVATMAEATDRPNAITYVKGTAVVRQLAALIGPGTVTRGLADYLTRFAPAGTGSLDDLIACWSEASGRDLAAWADEWLRTTGTPALTAELAEAPDGRIAALTVTQDLPRTHRVGVALYDTADQGRLVLRRTVPVELSATRQAVPGVAGEPLPAAVVVNAGDLALAHVTIDPRSLAALADAAFDVGDPLTEAACWNAAWHMVLSGELAPADFAALAARRIAGHSGAGQLAPSAAEALLGRALTCADRYVPGPDRARVRELVADAASQSAARLSATAPLRRVLLSGFAASAQAGPQLARARELLAGSADVRADLTLRAALITALARRGMASDTDLDSLTAADPVAGEAFRATCAASRPDAGAKETAWTAALADGASQRMARAHADGIWDPGQEELLTGYRDRYFTEALPVLNTRDARDSRGDRVARRLAGMLFPATFADARTVAATRDALRTIGLTSRIRAVLLEQEAELRTAATLRARE